MVLQGDDDGHEGRDGRRRGLPSEASGGRYATHCWALTRPLGRLGRHRLVSGGAIAQQWLVDREHDYASIYASIYAISCFDAPSCHDRYCCCCCCCYGLRYCYRYCRAGPLRQVRTGCDGGLYGDDGRRLRGQGGFGASTEQHGQAISGTTGGTQDELRGCRRPGLRGLRVRRTAEANGRQRLGKDGADRLQVTHKKTVGPGLGSPD
jgi:hypothetical protein